MRTRCGERRRLWRDALDGQSQGSGAADRNAASADDARRYGLPDGVSLDEVLTYFDPDWHSRFLGDSERAARFYYRQPEWAEAIREVAS